MPDGPCPEEAWLASLPAPHRERLRTILACLRADPDPIALAVRPHSTWTSSSCHPTR
jgi:hypothetical protein